MTGSKNRRRAGALVIAGLCVASPAPAQTGPPPTPSFAKPPYAVDLRAAHVSGSMSAPALDDVNLLYGGELRIQADRATGSLAQQHYDLTGNVRAHEADTTLTSDFLVFDGRTQQGVADHALLVQRPFTVHAREITFQPQQIVANEADFTTAPPDESPDYSVRVGQITLEPQKKRGVLRNATLYLFHARLLTIRHLPFTLGGTKRQQRQQFGPSFGYSGRYGAYLTFDGVGGHPLPFDYTLLLPTRQTPQGRIRSSQTLLPHPHSAPADDASEPVTANGTPDYLAQLRRVATAPKPPLPPDDPLLFHDITTRTGLINLFSSPGHGGLSLNEELAYHLQASGRRRDDLYVTRIPEAALHGAVPLTRVADPPPPGDPVAFRQYLRHVVAYADAQAAYGYYREQPTDVNANRLQLSAGLSLRPLLIAPNTVIQPRLSRVSNSYSSQKGAYQYSQVSVSLTHYFTPYNAVGAQLSASDVSGDSPFSFDVLDTSRELDLRGQFGNRRLSIGGLTRLDLRRHDVIDYSIAVAPGLHGFTPIFFYNFRFRSFGVGLEIPGLTF